MLLPILRLPYRYSPSVVFLPATFLFLMLAPGCSREPHPEQRQADSTLVLARRVLEGGDIRKSRILLHEAIVLDSKHDRLAQLGEGYRLLAGIATSMAEFDSAFYYLDKSLEQFRSLAERPLVRSITLEMASLHRIMGDERRAFTMYTEALRLANVFGDADGIREIQWAMLPACRALDEVEEEGRIISDLLKAYTASGDTGSQVRVYIEAGLSKLDRRDYEGATDSFLRALSLARQSNDSLLTITVLVRLAYTYERAGKSVESFQTYTDGLQRTDVTSNAGRLRDEMLIRVGNTYLRGGLVQEAARFYRAALPTTIGMGNKLAEGYLFIQLGHCELSDEEAIKKYQTALGLFTVLSFQRGIAYAELSLGLAFWKRNQFNDAQSHLIASVHALESTVLAPAIDDLYRECEEVFSRSIGAPAYDSLIELLLQLGKPEEAFSYTQRRDGWGIYSILGALDIQTQNERINALLARCRRQRGLRIGAERQHVQLLAEGPSHKQMLDGVQAQLTASAAGMTEAATQIAQANPVFGPAAKISTLSLADAQRRLPPGAVLIEAIPTTRALYLFVLTSSSLSVQVAAIEKSRVLSTTRAYIDALRQREGIADSLEYEQREVEQRIHSLSPVLYSWFIRPIESLVAGATKVLVVLPQELASFPVHALCKTVGRLASPYVIEQQAVSYLPSVYALSFDGKSVAPSRDIVGLGHPGRTSWDVEYELRDIRAFFKDARFYFQQQATLAFAQKERADVFHLVAEIQFSERSADNSFIMLSDGKSAATFRQVRWGQLYLLPPFPTVIVSNLAENRSGINAALPSILLMNGTGTVGLTSYAPSRKARKYFGEIFYTALLTGAASQHAFRLTQLEMIKAKEYSPPHVWAPFFLWGK
ncbi:MAG: hypothetical protein HW407_667 [Bacteroidetes bacterium]|nr:hypothetical protein [Bacteroidota bacterium]